MTPAKMHPVRPAIGADATVPQTPRSGRGAGGHATDAIIDSELRRAFCELGLSRYDAAVLVALLRSGEPVDTAGIAQSSSVPRTSIYGCVRRLAARCLVERLHHDGPATWRCQGLAVVLDRLDDTQEEDTRRHHQHTAELREAFGHIGEPGRQGREAGGAGRQRLPASPRCLDAASRSEPELLLSEESSEALDAAVVGLRRRMAITATSHPALTPQCPDHS